ncbi:MAG: HAD family phosphatase [Sphingobium sp.]|uniref:HAD family hydrolase n=1 Tax=Sphingobium sp. TaxID=1912891 RepID=UPI0029A7C4F0|nr:HAD family phosphatase [Sphingobium sp.]MDX3909937.1 HAD family phosphatase [Sphingobium sp.]
MGSIAAVIFDIGNVLFPWSPRILYERLIPDGQALDAFVRDVVSEQWHFQHDMGRDFADTSAELIALYPQHEALIRLWKPRFAESVGPVIDGMAELLSNLSARAIPLYAITNFSHEFWPPFRDANAAIFSHFRDIVVSGEEKLSKPDPAIYHLALARFGLEARHSFFIDDRMDNVEGARSVGMTAHHFQDAAGLRAELAKLGLLA